MYSETDLHEERGRIGAALGATPDPVLLNKLLDFATSVSRFLMLC